MEATPAEEAEGQAIVRVLAVVLDRLVSANTHLTESPQEQTHFHAQRAPAIGILQYLERIHKYASCSKECFILALIYIDRLIQRNNFLLTDLNVHRVVITAVLLAAKFFDDAYYNNAYYAKVGGVLVEEMNNLECQFLFKIDFSLRVLPEVFDKYSAELVSHSSAVGMEMISGSTDDELFARSLHRQQQQSMMLSQQQQHAHLQPELGACHQNMNVTVAAPQAAPLLHQTYPMALVDPVSHASHAPAAAPLEGGAHSHHYPIHALQQSLMEVQVAQQQQQQTVALDSSFQFPALAAQVSALQQAQAPPDHHPSELDLVYHAAAAPQDVSLPRFNVTNAPQAQVYSQKELNPAYHTLNPSAPTMDGGTTVHQQVAAAAAHMTHQIPSTYSQQEQYFNNVLVQAATAAQHPLLEQSNPEITPSPPAQPPIPPHGAPTAYHNGEVGVGTGGVGPINNLTSSVEYLKSVAALHRQQQQATQVHHPASHHHHNLSYANNPIDAALDMHLQQQSAHHHLGGHHFPSRPIAIGNQPRVSSRHQDNLGTSWSRMLSREMAASSSQ
eukprot:CAMPEP_0181137584 /NCGR_PEP_ID=MMETSP1071-20121207/33781_1 /TAXON_ID=35127 /ORGANISM="Thalassiosira sp., Strain NH16" /LENGTH=556 /DNA_ID=CAMNT_0023224343 /DNA_START=478 /DNA_END=2148 /DNA_ORIENTATION=+